jgi:hypothetical protein
MELNRYDQGTVNLWGKGYAHVFGQSSWRALAEAAMHAVLTGLRRKADTAELFRCYDADTSDEIELVRSVMPEGTDEQTLHDIRDAAFWLRWLQLTGRLT